jgi:hypothetical protein
MNIYELFTLIFLFAASICFWVGYHNVDLAFNFAATGLSDCSNDGCHPIEYRHSQGMDDLFVAYVLYFIVILPLVSYYLRNIYKEVR